MPGLPLVVRETTCSHSRTADQMCRQQSRVCLTAEEAFAAEESLSVYCKPVELYNILQRRAIRNPSFLQRSLYYKIQAKKKQRLQISVSFPRSLNAELHLQDLFPLHVLLVTPVEDTEVTENSAVYRLSQASVLTAFSEHENKDQTEAHFIIPGIKKLTADARIGKLTIIITRNGGTKGASSENQKDTTSSKKLERNCIWGKLPLEPLYLSVEKCVTLSLGHITDMHSTINMHSSVTELGNLDKDRCLTFQTQNVDSLSSCQVQVRLSAQEIGTKERSPYDSYTFDGVPSSSLPRIIRLRAGNVIFNYKYYNNMLQKTEVTEDFTCPFCLLQCASFKGLRCHLISSHDLFNFEFWVTEEFQAVNVSVRTDKWRTEDASNGVDPRLQTFFYCSQFRKCRRSKNLLQNVNNVHLESLESESPDTAREDSHVDHLQKNSDMFSSLQPMTYQRDLELPNELNSGNQRSSKSVEENHVLDARHILESYGSENHLAAEGKEAAASSPDTTDNFPATAQASMNNDSGSNLVPPTILQFAKTRKLSVERGDPRNRTLLQKREFFHSHRAQPMAIEQVFSDRDSEDEVDDDIADFEDRRMLDDFVDVTKDEKQIMHLWNSFVRKQRVLADGHIPWACEAFSRFHGQDLTRAPALLWCWRLLMIKLWNHSLLDSRTMNNCNLILERYQKEDSDQAKLRDVSYT